MRVLLLSQWYTPEPGIKTHLLARDLAARGHHPTALTGFPNYPQGQIYAGYRMRWRQWEQRDGIDVLRVPLYPSHDRSAIRRIANYVSFAVSASLLGCALCGPAEVMWVYHPPLTVGLPAMWISWLRNIPFIYEVQDMWPETLAATGMLPSRHVSSALASFAGYVYKRAAAITVNSPGFKRNLVNKGVPPEKIHVIPNWADEQIYRPVPRDQALAAEHGLANRFNIIFAGNLGAAQALGHVLEAAAQTRDLPSIQFVLIGDGVAAAGLRREARERGIDNVRFISRQPENRMPDFFAWAEGLLVHLKPDPLFAITIPSKTIAYLACGRPILCAVDGDAADVVRQAGAGLVCAPGDPHALAQAVRALYAMLDTERKSLGEAGRRAFQASYTRAVLMDRYEALFIEVANAKRAGQRKPGLFTEPRLKKPDGSPKKPG